MTERLLLDMMFHEVLLSWLKVLLGKMGEEVGFLVKEERSELSVQARPSLLKVVRLIVKVHLFS